MKAKLPLKRLAVKLLPKPVLKPLLKLLVELANGAANAVRLTACRMAIPAWLLAIRCMVCACVWVRPALCVPVRELSRCENGLLVSSAWAAAADLSGAARMLCRTSDRRLSGAGAEVAGLVPGGGGGGVGAGGK